MTTASQLRKAALGLRSVREETTGDERHYSVEGRTFARLTRSGHVELETGAERAARAVEEHAAAVRLERRGEPVGVRVPLAAVNGMHLNRLVYQAWLNVAPAELTEAQRLADAGAAPTGPDALPGNLGRPATSALLSAGIATLSDAAGCSASRLLSLHGFGPKALRLLQEALAERGERLADE